MLPRIWWVWRATSPSISLPVAGSWATCPLRNSSPTPRTPSENGPTGAASMSVAIASRVMVTESFHLRRWLRRAVGSAYRAGSGNWAPASRPFRAVGGVYTGRRYDVMRKERAQDGDSRLLSRARAGDGEAFRE